MPLQLTSFVNVMVLLLRRHCANRPYDDVISSLSVPEVVHHILPQVLTAALHNHVYTLADTEVTCILLWDLFPTQIHRIGG